MKINQKGFTLIETTLVLVVLSLFGGVGYYVYHSNHSKKQNSNAKITNPEDKVSQKPPDTNKTVSQAPVKTINKGWQVYEWQAQKLSIEYPSGWYIKPVGSNEIGISNYKADFNKGNFPADGQELYITVNTEEAQQKTANQENIKNGYPYGEVGGYTPSTVSFIKGEGLDITTYEHQSFGGTVLEAFWTDKSSKKFYASNVTERPNTPAMVGTLYKVLSSAKQL